MGQLFAKSWRRRRSERRFPACYYGSQPTIPPACFGRSCIIILRCRRNTVSPLYAYTLLGTIHFCFQCLRQRFQSHIDGSNKSSRGKKRKEIRCIFLDGDIANGVKAFFLLEANQGPSQNMISGGVRAHFVYVPLCVCACAYMCIQTQKFWEGFGPPQPLPSGCACDTNSGRARLISLGRVPRYYMYAHGCVYTFHVVDIAQ